MSKSVTKFPTILCSVSHRGGRCLKSCGQDRDKAHTRPSHQHHPGLGSSAAHTPHSSVPECCPDSPCTHLRERQKQGSRLIIQRWHCSGLGFITWHWLYMIRVMSIWIFTTFLWFAEEPWQDEHLHMTWGGVSVNTHKHCVTNSAKYPALLCKCELIA